jgi:cysteinyl-tRNA synthetase
MLRMTGEKMSKSLGNIAPMHDVLDEWGRETALVYYLTGHWHSPIDFSEERLREAAARVDGFREVFRNPSQPAGAEAWSRFEAALEDDFNTPAALALMHEWHDHELLRRALDVFGLASLGEQEDAPAELHELARGRQDARAAKDFSRADELREEIEAAGWEVRDDPGGYRLVPRR